MAGEDREKANKLAERVRGLEEDPHAFGFFHALRLIECLHADFPGFGRSRRPGEDPIRLAQEPSMAFESASLTSFKAHTDDKPHRLTVRLFGLLGPNGPLPLHLTEHAQGRMQRHHDPTFARFLDIFNNRMLGLFYRAWANNEPTVSFDRPAIDRFPDYVGALFGLGMSSLRHRDEVPDLAKLHFCGRLTCPTKCPEGLTAMLSVYFNLPAKLEESIGEWLPLPERDVFRLGGSTMNGTLGGSIVLGSRFFSCQHKFRVVLGPLGYDDYQSFLPCGSRIGHVVALVRNYSGDELAWDVNLILKWQEVPAMRLDGEYRLGWTTWLGERPVEEDADDLVLNVFEYITNPRKGGMVK
jgi:type VI secretion system protein ImpH